MQDAATILRLLRKGDKRALARAITIVENELHGYHELLTSLTFERNIPLIGVTGPPGAGKSTLINALIGRLSGEGKIIGVIAIDPTSPFNYGSLLGDRLRMSEHFNNEKVFIRSLATRGSLGGLSAKTIEITDVMRAFPFDMIIVETVGVGQSEVEIVGLADTTVLVLVPEAGDDVQAIKSGIMEIADIFVVNKADREGASVFVKNIHSLLHSRKASEWNTPVIKSIATQSEGVDELIGKIKEHQHVAHNIKRSYLLTEKAYRLIQNHRMKDVNKQELQEKISAAMKQDDFNLYRMIDEMKRG
jgi:LAO/AO transport system kinase